MKSKYFSCCRIPLPSTVHVQKVHVPCGCFSICSPVCISIKKGFVLFVSPLIGCAGRSIPHCEFSVSLPASRASHRLCTRSMASAASASFPAQPRAAHRARPASMPMCSASGAGRRSVEGPWPHAALTGFLSSRLPPYRYCNEHLLCPPHVFWTGWGPWERCTAQCGGGIQARRRTCENGPDCVGCNVVSRGPLAPGAGRAGSARDGCFHTRRPGAREMRDTLQTVTAHTRCSAHTGVSVHTICVNMKCSAHTRRAAPGSCSTGNERSVNMA